jgi:hypothetical protein
MNEVFWKGKEGVFRVVLQSDEGIHETKTKNPNPIVESSIAQFSNSGAHIRF